MPQLARESRYLGRNIGQGSEVPIKQNIFFPLWVQYLGVRRMTNGSLSGFYIL